MQEAYHVGVLNFYQGRIDTTLSFRVFFLNDYTSVE